MKNIPGGRAHVLIPANEEIDLAEQMRMALRIMVTCFIYNNDIFNLITKYTQYGYPDFNVHAGMDYGEYIEYEIDDTVNESEFTSIGAVANNAAKIQSFSPCNYVYILDRYYNELPPDLRESFSELTNDEVEELKPKLKSSKVYKAKYNHILTEKEFEEISKDLEDIKTAVNEEANKLDISEMSFEEVNTKLDFSRLSRKVNKKTTAGVLCADIRGFTKLFNKSDSNLEDLSYIMQQIYDTMGETVNEQFGTKVQYQGDRVVAVFNDFKGSEDYRLRLLKTGMKLNEAIQGLNDNPDISEKLSNHKLRIGIGCSIGQIIATRLGMRSYKDNIILSEAADSADICEERYAENNKIVIGKQFYDEIKSEDGNKNLEYQILRDNFTAISTTGYYECSLTFSEFLKKVEEKQLEKASKIAKNSLSLGVLTNSAGESARVGVRPWRP
ncbi:adenylate/guanylate cyclase domain-containing protein [Desulforamulus aeronauticus]|uniref:Adenylate cyclase, class 3 n=1 Tax=Desulforamulus aeronauticus DSM 10349 TaxID=1121421 RepID=A0A1M6QFE2_9FIRM|nr:adenylate/guanylate cyclase domain-containing protein [Desulforamulus aeronauticus]SHK18777.1 Adenylate cyclase, class 3 [Desulforamulus aeronauticus DSM 10349]